MELRPQTGRPEDRLATAVFVAALLHGLFILGVRFAAPSSDDRPLPTLEVLLVPDGPAEDDNPEASYIASRSQHGAATALIVALITASVDSVARYWKETPPLGVTQARA